MTQVLPAEHERKTLETIVGGGTTTEAVAGLGAGTLAVLGLADVLPFYMVTIGIIVAGAALLVEGLSVGGAYARLRHDHVTDDAIDHDIEVPTGLSVQVLGGAVAIVLGILALIGLFSPTLSAIAIIALGAGLLLGGPTRAELNWNALDMRRTNGSSRVLATQAVQAASGLLALVGLGAIVLGIIAMVQAAPHTTPTSPSPYTLVLIGLLSVGVAELFGGTALLGRVVVGAKR